ncbi:MAG: hypothetical protein MJ252_26405 [archaeon]|nr:hypothetical protein [archaeon]
MKDNKDIMIISKKRSCAYTHINTRTIQNINLSSMEDNKYNNKTINKINDNYSMPNSDNDVIHLTNENIESFLQDNPFKDTKFAVKENPKHNQRFDRNSVPIKKEKPNYHHITFIDQIKVGNGNIPLVEEIEVECHKKYQMTNTFVNKSKGERNCCCSVF